MKNQKGITLVALIITIIVMLILAGVSISLVVGENGVLTQAQGADEKTEKAEVEQAISLAFADLMMQHYEDEDDETTFSLGNIQEAIRNNGNFKATDTIAFAGDFEYVATKTVNNNPVKGEPVGVESKIIDADNKKAITFYSSFDKTDDIVTDLVDDDDQSATTIDFGVANADKLKIKVNDYYYEVEIAGSGANKKAPYKISEISEDETILVDASKVDEDELVTVTVK